MQQHSDQNRKKTVKHWVTLYADSIYSWALYKTSSKEIAEDLVQETYLAAMQSFHTFKGKSSPKTWLFAILNNKINDHFRNRFRNPVNSESALFEQLFDAEKHWKPEAAPQQWYDAQTSLLDDAEFYEILKKCLRKLPANSASVIRLKFIKQKKSSHICKELGITPTNLWQLVHRGKLQLRACLELNWFKPK